MAPLVVALDALGRDMLELAGGKAINLGAMRRAGLAVPDGACLTTAAFDRAAQAADLAPLIDRLAAAAEADMPPVAEAIRMRLEHVALTDELLLALRETVASLGLNTPLAVRSSATAEDLPFASFAGQQDTILNVSGFDGVADAVRRCWASLWTARAVAYRRGQGIDPHGVRLAVVLQGMVDASVAGVLFTANPLTGRRGQGVVEASPGLGEAVVSGAVNPDHWTIDMTTGGRLDGPSHGCLSDAQLRGLARLGEQVQRLFGAPQDIEFAFDGAGTPWLVQARAITTLYPLPASVPRDQRDLRVYLSLNVVQGVYRPFTPLGADTFALLSIAVARMFGVRRTVPLTIEAGDRLFLDITTPLRSPFWRPLLRAGLRLGEARSADALEHLLEDSRLALTRTSRRRAVMGVARALWRTRIPPRVAVALIAPPVARQDLARLRREVESAGKVPADAAAEERLASAEDLLTTWPPRIMPRLVAPVIAGVASFEVAGRLLGDLASNDERDTIRRALPHDPTTEMDLTLWRLSRTIHRDVSASAAVRERTPAELAAAYHAATLPGVLQQELRAFLAQYGHRAVAEIDLGLPRWADDPSPLLANLANYLAIDDGPRSPEAQFRAAAEAAEQTVERLWRRAAQRSALRGVAVRWLLRRGRGLAGMREMPKFVLVELFARVRTLVQSVGAELHANGRLDDAEDVFYLSFREVRQALGGADLRAQIDQRRARYAVELRRRHVPRLLLSDGTEPSSAPESASGESLRGTPASAGQVTGRARVILEPSGARLEPGDILVAPSTDPGWTPLFLSAAGLVMEMGGAMSHGAVVAREYGIPAVVGVLGATERIADGATITVDGSQGTVSSAPHLS
jgi:pyruvate,water dikinase